MTALIPLEYLPQSPAAVVNGLTVYTTADRTAPPVAVVSNAVMILGADGVWRVSVALADGIFYSVVTVTDTTGTYEDRNDEFAVFHGQAVDESQNLARAGDVERRMGVSFTLAQYVQAVAMLTDSSALIKAETGQDFIFKTDDRIELLGNSLKHLRLPQRPVVGISLVQVGGITVSDAVFDGRDELWRPGGWGPYSGSHRESGMYGQDDGGDLLTDGRVRYRNEAYSDVPSVIAVTYDHGYRTIPAEVVAIACSVGMRTASNPTGLRSENIGDYSYTTAIGAGGGALYLTDNERETLERYSRGQVRSLRLRR